MIKFTTQEIRCEKPRRHEYCSLKKTPILIICDNITSSFNLGAMFRLSAALMLEKIYVCGSSPFFFNKKFKKTAKGSHSWTQWVYHENSVELIKDLKSRNIMVVAVELSRSSISYTEADYQFPVAFVFGNEKYGVDEDVLELSDLIIDLPMPGMINSLNVSTAASVVLYDAYQKYISSRTST